MKALLSIAVLLPACSGEAASPANEPPVAPAVAPAGGPMAQAFVAEEENDLIEFRYAWSAEAAAVPELVERFRKEMATARADLVAGAEEDKATRERQGGEFHGHMSSTDHETAGQSVRLLSLAIDHGSYTGGAHGNYGVASLLWDRSARKEIKFGELFTAPANMERLLTQRWCDALNAAREKKRGEPVGGDGMFDECPTLAEIALIPTDRNGNGRFESLQLVASPYVAGPWVEGSYEIDLAMTPDLLAALRGEYQGDFEAALTQ